MANCEFDLHISDSSTGTLAKQLCKQIALEWGFEIKITCLIRPIQNGIANF